MEIMLNAKRTFFTTMLGLLNNFSPFLLKTHGQVNCNDIFDKKSYLGIFQSNDSVFINDLVQSLLPIRILLPGESKIVEKTMLFQHFIEEAY